MKFKEQKALKSTVKDLNNPNTNRVDGAFINFKDAIVKHKNLDLYQCPSFKTTIEKSIYELDLETRGSSCLHKNCVGCKNGTCSGMHMISCSCRSCSIWC